VAGRYFHVRTVRRTLRSRVVPALSRIRGLCTRPSVPMIKLTFTFALATLRIISGAGVVRAWGGWTSPQPEGAAAVWGMSLNVEALASGRQATSSRCGSVAGRTVGMVALTLAKASADTARIKTGQRRRIGFETPVRNQLEMLVRIPSSNRQAMVGIGRNPRAKLAQWLTMFPCYGLGEKP